MVFLELLMEEFFDLGGVVWRFSIPDFKLEGAGDLKITQSLLWIFCDADLDWSKLMLDDIDLLWRSVARHLFDD